MEFVFETEYNQKGITDMAKALRKTIRKKSTKRSNILAVIIIILTVLISIPTKGEPFSLKANIVFTWIVTLLLIIVLVFQDKINAYIARKRMVKGSEKSVVTFKDEVYISDTEIGKTEFRYNNISVIAETKDYFVFIIDKIHAQLYDKNGITNGTVDEFRKFIKEKTKLEIQKVK